MVLMNHQYGVYKLVDFWHSLGMNWNHIDAMLRGTGRFQWSELDGGILFTNGNMAVAKGESTIIATGESYPPLAKLWKDFTCHMTGDAQVGTLARFGRTNLWRSIGVEWIDEAYFRCFPGARWMAGPKRAVIPLGEGDSPVGIVMPLRVDAKDRFTPVDGISDAEVFSRFSSERNDYYAMTQEKIAREISDLQASISNNKDRITEIESEIDGDRRSITRLERLADERNLHVEPLRTDAKTD